MSMLVLGLVLGWLVTGLCDYAATRRAVRRAYAAGVEAGETNALRQVAGW